MVCHFVVEQKNQGTNKKVRVCLEFLNRGGHLDWNFWAYKPGVDGFLVGFLDSFLVICGWNDDFCVAAVNGHSFVVNNSYQTMFFGHFLSPLLLIKKGI